MQPSSRPPVNRGLVAAEQPSDAFDSALQYGAVIYGKAPGFYFAVGDLIGWDVLVDALRDYVAENAFTLVSTDSLRQHLIDSAAHMRLLTMGLFLLLMLRFNPRGLIPER